MDPLLLSVVIALAGCVAGIVIGWRLALHRYQRLMVDMEQESGARSLELLETRRHLRKVSDHLKTTLRKDKTIRQLRRRQKSLQREIDQHVLRARRQEKAHFIQTAKIKLELIEARLHNARQSESQEAASANANGAANGTVRPLASAQLNGGQRAVKSANGNAMPDNYLTENLASDASAASAESADFGHLNNELQSLLEQAGIKRIRQLARLSKQDIEQLTSQRERQAAE